ncbi:MAG TPA: protein kinase [Polyangiales bacterium]|nr:protein kinase [Polyangiales bacterium]
MTHAPDTVARFAQRYELHEELGRGGMAVVYRATDQSTGRVLALKQLLRHEQLDQHAQLELLFEREFHTLSQLRHPCVIDVYDYGITADGACYYTMALLEGTSLRERSPLGWREVCRIGFDVCSALALLHSRGLLHRDVSPRNVYCTANEAAKLIDFGAVVPMSGATGFVVGTPPFIAPEMMQRSALDGRSDLYSLGATLYYALCRRVPYQARSFAELSESWKVPPTPPSRFVPDVPVALDDLLLSMLSLQPGLRPPSAFAVMQQLAALAGFEHSEAASVSRAYLTTPALTGRDDVLKRVRELLPRVLSTGGRAVLLRGPAGIGRSRMLDACALEAKLLGACVLRANALGEPRDFQVVFALAQHLVESMPREQLALEVPELFVAESEATRLLPLSELCSDRASLERSLVQLMRLASKIQPLVFAVDDAQTIDEASAAVLATLVDRFRYGRAFAVFTALGESDAPSQALDVLAKRCEEIVLPPLRPEETQSLLASIFGDVPNLERISEEIHALARGNPRASLDLAQHLIDREVIAYSGGTWTLPNRLDQGDLPASAEHAIRARIEQLSLLARFLGQAHALSLIERLSTADYCGLAPGAEPHAVDVAVRELLVQQALISDGESYIVANRVWRVALETALEVETRERAHRALAAWFKLQQHNAWIHHALASETGEHEAAIDALLAISATVSKDVSQLLEQEVPKLAPSHRRALALAQRLGRPLRHQQDLRRAMLGLAVVTGEIEYYREAAPEYLEQLVRDSGLGLWRTDSQNKDAGARLTQALTKAFERYQAESEAQRCYRPDEAIALLAEYSGHALAIAVRTMDLALIQSTPTLLEPFAPLSPLLNALWQNGLGIRECHEACRYEAARARWTAVHATLRDVQGADVRHLETIRNANAYGIGLVEAVFGLASAAHWADELEQNPLQRVNGLYLRKIVRLEQGDWAGAARLQRSAELLALRSRLPPLFNSTFTVEISAHVLARDLHGVQGVIERERVEAERYPGWIPYLLEAEARFELIRGDFARARSCFERLSERTAPDADLRSPCMAVWLAAQGGLCETLLALELAAEARQAAIAALAICKQVGVGAFAYEVERQLALAEAKLGDFDAAVARLDSLIAAQTELGVSGLRLGVTYEARAEVALWAGDAAKFEAFASLTAREYRHGSDCPLSARYERLANEARRRGIQLRVSLEDFVPTQIDRGEQLWSTDLPSLVRNTLSRANDTSDRYGRALEMICESRAARGGHLYLVEDQVPTLVATRELPAPNARLAECIREYLDEQEDRFDTQTVAVHGTPELTMAPLTRVDGADYELLLLSRLSEQEAAIVGVIALAPGPQDKANPRQTLLLTSIAEQLYVDTSQRTLKNSRS